MRRGSLGGASSSLAVMMLLALGLRPVQRTRRSAVGNWFLRCQPIRSVTNMSSENSRPPLRARRPRRISFLIAPSGATIQLPRHSSFSPQRPRERFQSLSFWVRWERIRSRSTLARIRARSPLFWASSTGSVFALLDIRPLPRRIPPESAPDFRNRP